MWITDDVELPHELIDAHAAGNVVFFVGAGASMDAPSGLPSFVNLAKKLARLADVPFSRRGGVDFFLGSLPDDFDVHTHARDEIDLEGSAPNTTHDAIVRVARAGGPLRIVTTNFDTHLSTAAANAQIPIIDTWHGPALPLGGDFEGIVHLHGVLTRDASELILTDRDFGRAYLTDAWAARFLLPMFEKYVVVFVGYSHDDTIMRYLSLGLPSQTRRYAFVADDAGANWAHLRVTPIVYRTRERKHTNLVNALNRWAELAGMGLLQHEALILNLVRGGPDTLTPADQDYLVGQLRTQSGARQFADTATEPRWLAWAETVDVFRALFDGRPEGESSFQLAQWFASAFVQHTSHTREALRTAQRLGLSFSPSLVSAIEFATGTLRRQDASAAHRWQTILTTSVPGHSAPGPAGIGMRLKRDNAPQALAVIRALLRPHLSLERGWPAFDHSPPPEVRWSVKVAELDAVVGVAISDSDMNPGRLLSLMEDALCSAYDLVASWEGEQAPDPFSFRRISIAHSPYGYRRRGHIDVIVDGLRDLGIRALPTLPHLAEWWWALDHTLFRRLALHLVHCDSSFTADEQLQWVMEHRCMEDAELWQETVDIIRVSLPKSSPVMGRRLLEDLKPTHSPAAGLTAATAWSERDRFDLVELLLRVEPQWTEARSLRDSMGPAQLAGHPEQLGEHGEERQHSHVPLTAGDLIRTTEEDPDAALSALLGSAESGGSRTPDVWHLLTRTSQQSVSTSLQLWDAFERRPDLSHRRASFIECILQGWIEADLQQSADVVHQRLLAAARDEPAARTVARFVLKRREQDSAQSAADETTLLRDIARVLWAEHAASFTPTSDDVGMMVLNSWPGMVARFWSGEIRRRWRSAPDEWDGLSDEERAAMDALLEGPSTILGTVGPALAHDFYVLFSADEDYATARLLPLFSAPEHSAKMWEAFLLDSRVNERLLRAGFSDALLQQWSHLDGLSGDSDINAFYSLTANALDSVTTSSARRRKLLSATVLADGGKHAEPFASMAVYNTQSRASASALTWRRWLGDHVHRRLRGIPRNASARELSYWADIIPDLGDAIPAAVELFRGRAPGLTEMSDRWEWNEVDLNRHSATLVGHLAERIRNTSRDDFAHAWIVGTLLEGLREHVDDDAVAELTAAARESGFARGQ